MVSLWVDLFAAYMYSCHICLLEYLIVFKPKNNLKIPVGKCNGYTRMLQMNPAYVLTELSFNVLYPGEKRR